MCHGIRDASDTNKDRLENIEKNREKYRKLEREEVRDAQKKLTHNMQQKHSKENLKCTSDHNAT